MYCIKLNTPKCVETPMLTLETVTLNVGKSNKSKF